MAGVRHVERFEVYWVNFDPTVGHEIQKTRPAVIISPNDMNQHIKTVIVAPLSTTIRPYRSRPILEFAGQRSQIGLDQLRCVDKARLRKRMGNLSPADSKAVLATLQEMFAA
ncbi:MAG: type II toxin-antitoxin system PemK/MazF family toxin [Rickettsiales bacterium]